MINNKGAFSLPWIDIIFILLFLGIALYFLIFNNNY